MPRTKIAAVNAIAELERLGWKFEPATDDEVRLRCPNPEHDDDSPSASLNVRENLWFCQGCKKKGDVVTALAMIAGVSRAAMIVDLSERYDLEQVKTIPSDTWMKFHQTIWDAGPLLEALRARGVTDDDIRAAKIGYHNGRICIPVFDAAGRCRNVRRYLPGAPGADKMRNTKGFSKPLLYQPKGLDYDRVWLLGGEIKALVAGRILAEVKVGATAPTCGEGNWDNKWSRLFKDKIVYVCMDADAVGRAAAQTTAAAIAPWAKEVRIVSLPLDPAKYPHGDINDYVGQEGAGLSELLKLMEMSAEYVPRVMERDAEKGIRDTSLGRVAQPENVGYRLQFKALATAMDTTPYLVPKTVKVSCTRDQPNCGTCPIMHSDPDEAGFVEKLIGADSGGILELVGTGKKGQESALKDAIGIPACKTVEFAVHDHWDVVDARLGPPLEIGKHENVGNVQQPAFVVGKSIDLNVPYDMAARVYPHPRSSQATLVVHGLEETEDSLSSFAPGGSELEALRIFQPASWTAESVAAKLDDIAEDLAANVTKIFGRPELHAAIDLVYHSPLFVNFGGKRVNGWVNGLVIGDSAQGKTEASTCLMNFYGLGERLDCKNATVAGLMGGLEQMGNRWFVKWGAIPTHDRRLIILEELKGASVEIVGKLTDMRSSGIAEIPKIERRRAHARTRLLLISNARGSRSLASHSFGCEAVHRLMGALEDVRRLDFAVALQAGQVEDMRGESRPHVYDEELCRRLILWCWTRQPEEVLLEDEECVYEWSDKLCKRYSEVLPLIDRGTTRLKLARLAAAAAGRTFSADGDKLVVRPCHVEWVARWLDDRYSDDAMGYARFSSAQENLDRMSPGDRKSAATYIQNTSHPGDLVRGLLLMDELAATDIQDLCEVDGEVARFGISLLVRTRSIKRKGRNSYIKTAGFIDLLRELSEKDLQDPEDDDF